jgi:hypothetical protein
VKYRRIRFFVLEEATVGSSNVFNPKTIEEPSGSWYWSTCLASIMGVVREAASDAWVVRLGQNSTEGGRGIGSRACGVILEDEAGVL